MDLLGLALQVIGMNPLLKVFGSKDTVGQPLKDGCAKLGVSAEALVKKATPVLTGNMRSSITRKAEGNSVSVFAAGVEYAPYVEYGTYKMEARHVEGSNVRVFGVGPFAYAANQLQSGIRNTEKEIAKDVENKFNLGRARGMIPMPTGPTMPRMPF